MTARRIVLFHAGGNFELAANTRAKGIESAARAGGERVTVEVHKVSTASQLRNALLYGSTNQGLLSQRKPPANTVEFFTHSGPHGIYLSNRPGAETNLALGRTFLSDSGAKFKSTPYRNALANLSQNAMIAVHGCKFGQAKNGRSPGAKELADATGAAVSAYRSGTIFTHDLELATGLRNATKTDMKAKTDSSQPVWMVPNRWNVSSQRKTFWPARQNITSSQPSSMQYKIKPGDTLSKIASLHGLEMREILRVNPTITNPNQIRAGANLNLPTLTRPMVASRTSPIRPSLQSPFSPGPLMRYNVPLSDRLCCARRPTFAFAGGQVHSNQLSQVAGERLNNAMR